MLEEIILHIYYENNFIEVDISSFNKTRVTIGKNAQNDIYLNSQSLIENHALIEEVNGEVYIVDLSENDIYFNNNYFKRIKVNFGDVFILCKSFHKISRVAIIFNRKKEFIGEPIKYSLEKINNIFIGREIYNNIIFNNKSVSKKHSEIYKKDNNLYIRDLNSANGTFLNGKIVQESILKNGDFINIGGFKIIFQTDYLLINKSGNTLIKGLELYRIKAPGYPYFKRSPRIEPLIPDGEIEIPKPILQSSKPSMTWPTIIIPPVGLAVITVVMWLFIKNPLIIVSTGIMSFITLISTLTTYLVQRKNYQNSEKKRKEKYSLILQKKKSEIQFAWDQQKKIMNEKDPDFLTCLSIVENKDKRLWERNLNDKDFLSIRIGTGNVPINVIIKSPVEESYAEDDKLIEDAKKIISKFFFVNNVPICIPLRDYGTIGIIGNRNSAIQVAKNLIVQLSTLHSYNEVKVVVIFSENEKEDWYWVRWLPHVWDENRLNRFLISERDQATRIPNHLYEVIKTRQFNLISTNEKNIIVPQYVFFIADSNLVENEPIMDFLTQSNQKLGIYSIFLFNKVELLPKDCRYIIDIKNDEGFSFDRLSPSKKILFNLDTLSLNYLDQFSRSIAPIRLKEIGSTAELPSTIPFLELFNVEKVEDLNIIKRWENNKAYNSLAALVGIRQDGEGLILDIHEKVHGPHGLIAGMTGYGKSEFLKTFILALTINYSPNNIAFLLIDFKGGEMANSFSELPHLAGIISNLDRSVINRALLSIKGEIARRQEIFKKNNINHIDNYLQLFDKGQFKEPLPNLIIIIDEFGQLKTQQPDFMDEFIAIARIGRSLGIHLILATQNPSGIINEQISSNSKFRICFKVQDIQNSREVIKSPDAANITIPGRGYIQVGNNEVFDYFQSAYTKSDYSYEIVKNKNSQEIYEILINGTKKSINKDKKQKEDGKIISQSQVIVKYIYDITKQSNIKKNKNLWFQPLPNMIFLKNITKDSEFSWNGMGWRDTVTNLTIKAGLVDDPANQIQYPLEINFLKDGNLLIYGGPGSGKTSLLQTIIFSLALSYSPEDVNIYMVDFGARVLNIFSDLPHAGDIVFLEDEDKLKRLFEFVLKEIDYRKRVFSEKGISSYKTFKNYSDTKLPAIFLIVDNFPELVETYQDFQDYFVKISREGTNLGIFLVLSLNNPLSLNYKIKANFNMALTLQMPDKSMYIDIVGRTFGLEPAQICGRGLIKGNPPLEFQSALPVEGLTEMDRFFSIKSIITEMNKSGKYTKAKSIPTMPDIILVKDIISIAEKQPFKIPIGIDFEDLKIQYLNLKELNHLLIAGNIQSGKTNFLKIFLSFLTKNFKKGSLILYVIDSYYLKLNEFKNTLNVKAYITDKEQLKKAINQIRNTIDLRKVSYKEYCLVEKNPTSEKDFMEKYPKIFMFIDDYNDFINLIDDEEKKYLENIILRERSIGFHLIAAGMLDSLASQYDGLTKSIKSLQEGIIFGNLIDQQIFNVKANYAEVAKNLKPGEGYIIKRSNYKKIKLILYSI
jgi:S-DNA-T family DNA segregation ATPase FtsK/SpoIIIE